MKSARIVIEKGCVDGIAKEAKKMASSSAILADANTRIVAGAIAAKLRNAGVKCERIIIRAGERFKRLSTVEECCSALLARNIRRDGILIGVGGGVVCDMTGFIASVYMRGIPHILVPTTLLAMTDASIGGKTGVDLKDGKNMIGTFYAPRAVYIDPALLKELPTQQYRMGFAEIIKHAVIGDSRLFTLLEKQKNALMKRESEALAAVLRRSIGVKMKIVSRDARESLIRAQKGRISRMFLNYGHTVGHAIEEASGYTVAHGEAVAMGMVSENRIAVSKKLLRPSDAARISRLISAYGFSTHLPRSISSARMLRVLERDKKNFAGKIHFAVPVKIGKMRIVAYDFA